MIDMGIKFKLKGYPIKNKMGGPNYQNRGIDWLNDTEIRAPRITCLKFLGKKF